MTMMIMIMIMILQYLSGLASPSLMRDQSVVRNFLAALGSRDQGRDPMFYLGIIQKMKGEWYNQEGTSYTHCFSCIN